jgi:hypothetical protein
MACAKKWAGLCPPPIPGPDEGVVCAGGYVAGHRGAFVEPPRPFGGSPRITQPADDIAELARIKKPGKHG